MARERTATVLKILRGSARLETTRDEEAVQTNARPVFPLLAEADADERKMFEWMVDTYYIPCAHAAKDGQQFLQLAKCAVRMQRLEAQVKKFGEVIKDPKTGRPMRSPFAVARDATATELRKLMQDLGATPASRLKFAPPVVGKAKSAQRWDAFD